MKIQLTAIRPLRGDYGTVNEGQRFETDEDTADSLMARGLAQVYYEPQAAVIASKKAMKQGGK